MDKYLCSFGISLNVKTLCSSSPLVSHTHLAARWGGKLLWKFLKLGCEVLVFYKAIYECRVVKFYCSIFFPLCALTVCPLSETGIWYMVWTSNSQPPQLTPTWMCHFNELPHCGGRGGHNNSSPSHWQYTGYLNSSDNWWTKKELIPYQVDSYRCT